MPGRPSRPGEQAFEAAFLAASGGRKWGSVDKFLDDPAISEAQRVRRRRKPAPWELLERSELLADLRAGRKEVRFRRAATPGDWATKAVEETLPAEFWRRAQWEPVWRDEELVIRHRTPNGIVEYVDMVVVPAAIDHPAETHSGTVGRPTSKHLYLAELKQRAERGELEARVGKQAQVLFDWFLREQPKLNPSTPRAIENLIRSLYNELRRQNCIK